MSLNTGQVSGRSGTPTPITPASMTEREILKKLVTEEHISVAERKQLPNQTANTAILVEIISERLETIGKFPDRNDLDDDFDGGLIFRSPSGEYHVYQKAEVSLMKFAVVKDDVFKDPQAAARTYLKANFAGNIDGVPLAEP
ncbi:MAG: hypothetical protein COV67_04500 [Nitrospinae bacterium CG11_big_fil_rev_8_21_14_0_20_56_8]|nr:MAG: hypothetical protein COV67_04500 [Nitrospinae bacterium CG11_big_fil_rev_8_21_14_0_20_56_8]